MKNFGLLMIFTAIISLIFTPLVRKFAIKIKAIDIPKDKRRVHKKPIPLLGGIAIFIAFVLGVLCKGPNLTLSDLGILLGASIITVGGIIDDIKDIKPIYKLLFQLSGVIVLILCGVKIDRITNPFSRINPFIDIELFCIPLTIIWVMGITNAFNLIDGLDGLSAGIAFIGSTTLFVISILNGRTQAAYLTAILSGALIGFLPYNFYPAKIFMGDTGAQLIGFLLAAISIEGSIKSATAFTLAVPILIFGLPISDTLFAIIRRKINGKPITQADKGHLHHRILELGFSQKQAVIIMYLLSTLLCVISIVAMLISTQRAYFLLTFVIIVICFIAWKNNFFEHKE